MRLHPYLLFTGCCEEAMTFYAEILGGRLSGVHRYSGSPLAGDVPPGWENKVMHMTLQAGPVVIMAADAAQLDAGANNVRAQLSLATADHAQGQRVFDALAAGGTITTPYEKQFWGASFGTLTDRYGIDWMVNAE